MRNLLAKTCGEESQHFKEFEKAEKPQPYTDNYQLLKKTKAVFMAAQEDFDGGLLNSIKTLVQAEIFDNELEQAKELLTNGYYVPSAIIAGVVLETSLRELCTSNGITIGKLDKMNADLAKIGLINKLRQKRITAIADIRNNAAHGNYGAFTKDDVARMIDEVEEIVASF